MFVIECLSSNVGYRMPGYLRLALLTASDHVIVAGTQGGFPSGDGKREDMLEFVVVRLVRREHGSSEHSHAAGRIDRSAGTGLHKGSRQRIHLTKAGISQGFLRGECVRDERRGHRRQPQ